MGSPRRSQPHGDAAAGEKPKPPEGTPTPAVSSPLRETPAAATGNYSPTPPESPSPPAVVVNGSPVESPPKSVESPPKPLPPVSRAQSLRDEAAAKSPTRSPSRDSLALVPVARTTSVREEAASGSPARPVRGYEKEDSFRSASSSTSPVHDVENPVPVASPPRKEAALGPPVTVGSLLWSRPGDATVEDPVALEKVTSPMMAHANQTVARQTSTTRVGGSGGGGRGSMRVEFGTSGPPLLTRTTIGLRLMALVFSLISFSVMAADKTSGWNGDSFDRYQEFRYCLSMNVLAFVYSLFQIYALVHQKVKKKWIMSRPVSYTFDFSMDQILSYLLMSASSAAASRNGDWVSDFGSDDFTKGISASIALSFLAFFTLAFSSIISAYKFFTWNF